MLRPLPTSGDLPPASVDFAPPAWASAPATAAAGAGSADVDMRSVRSDLDAALAQLARAQLDLLGRAAAGRSEPAILGVL